MPDTYAQFDNWYRMETKRARHMCSYSNEPELFPSKKQAVEEAPFTNPRSRINFSNAFPCENSTRFQQVPLLPNPFMDPLCLGADGSNVRGKVTNQQFENDYSVDLSISFNMEVEERGVNYGGTGNFLVNPAKDSVNRLHPSVDQSYGMESENTLEQQQPFGEKGRNVTLDYPTDKNIRSLGSTFEQGTDKKLADYQKSIMALLESPFSSYSLLYEQPPVLTSKMRNGSVSKSRAPKFKLDPASRNKQETKAAKKEAPNNILTNVRSLTGTGMLNGVPVRYISSSREELLHGIIRGSGYLCGCQSCNYSKVISAIDFERHAGCKTNHPNNHIFLENGKAMHQIVQELKNTPLSKLSEMDLPKGNNIVCTFHEKNNPFKLDSASKCEPEIKASKKEETKAPMKEETKAAWKRAQSNFPSNVKCLLMTRLFDGAPVQYISSSREGALSGIIKDSGYLCGCESCNYSKVVTAHEFQCHADCNTRHPNNHIHFVNGKSIAEIVQELRSTPLNMLFDVIQTITGFPINQKAFDTWKVSFIAANRELQRVYGNEEPNILE